jgi:hypothetical protein
VANRHRIKGVKREHSVISGLLPVLERIAALPEVSAVIPGRIAVTRAATPSLELRLGPRTPTGFKLNARKASTTQEVFVVTAKPDEVIGALSADVKEFR